MAEPKTLDEAVASINELVRIYEQVSETEIPQTIREAKEQKWQLIPNGIVIAGLVHYSHEEQRLDGSRVISLPRALELMEAYEDDLIAKTVKAPDTVFVGKIRFMSALVQRIGVGAGILWDFCRATVSAWDILELLAWIARLGFIFDLFDPESRLRVFLETMYEIGSRFSLLILSGLLTALAIPTFSRTVLDVERVREFWIAKVRKAALPQGSGRRVFRRKVSRL